MLVPSVPLEALNRAYRLWNQSRGTDPSGFLDLMAEKVDWQSVGEGHVVRPLGFVGTRSSKSDVVGYFQRVTDDWQMEHFLVEDIICEGGNAVVIADARYIARATGKHCTSQVVNILRFQDGKIVRFREMFDTAAALSALLPEVDDEDA